MKYITAIIQPFKLESVREELSAVGIEGMTVSQAKGHGRQKGHREIYRGSEYQIDFLPKLVVEIAVSDDQVEKAITTIRQASNTSTIGDGKIFVSPMEAAMRIRTGEMGDTVL